MKLRRTNLQKLKTESFDVMVVGGGINGAVSAAALAAKGANVALIDKGDFASFTSQQSSNLAWGGIKYMESYEFPLVRKLCQCRNHLIESYPSTVKEIRFFTTLTRGFRHHRFLVFMGSVLYWIIGNFFTKPPRLLGRSTIEASEPIVKTDEAVGGVEYSDAYLHDNDARFAFGFIRSAMNYGCVAVNYIESQGASRDENGLWTFKLTDQESGETFETKAKYVVNACGPFADAHNKTTDETTDCRHVFSKGIHLIVPKLTPNKRVLTFFADDGRMFFVIPMGPRTCIGTTDTRVDRPESFVTQEDRQFVLENINKRLNLEKPLTESDIIAERCGVRPLVVQGNGDTDRDWVQLSRKHQVVSSDDTGHVSIYGGKLTDCLNVGDEVCEALMKMGLNLGYPQQKWYGEPSDDVRDEFMHQAHLMGLDDYTHPDSSEPLSSRFWRRYGQNAFSLLESIRREPSMAEVLIEGVEYTRCEIWLTRRYEMVTRLEDFLRRRSKIELVTRPEDLKNADGLREACEIFFEENAESRLQEYFQLKDNDPSLKTRLAKAS